MTRAAAAHAVARAHRGGLRVKAKRLTGAGWAAASIRCQMLARKVGGGSRAGMASSPAHSRRRSSTTAAHSGHVARCASNTTLSAGWMLPSIRLENHSLARSHFIACVSPDPGARFSEPTSLQAVLFPRRLQLLAKGQPSTIQPRFHGADRKTERLGDLFVGHSFHVIQNDHDPLKLRE